MKVIKGFIPAKEALERPAFADFDLASPALRRRLRTMFGIEEPVPVVRQIISDVRGRGDSALFDLCQKIDGVELTELEVGQQKLKDAYRAVDPKLVSGLRLAAERIRAFHTLQKEKLGVGFIEHGVGQLVRSLERVGVYVPGGTAAYPSTVLMTVIPAKIAGVKEVILTTAPKAGGLVPPSVLVAADLAGVDRIFRVGGAQAIAALAFGTESIPRVDKICGPGNIFVVLAKKEVYGAVAIDGLQGPSEIVIIADETANPEYCAADLLAQAEHDPLASAILITTSTKLADLVNREVERQLAGLSRKDIAVESLASNGKIIVIDSIDEAISLANLFAPEHLSLMVTGANSYVGRIANAGCVFVGDGSTVVFGDYVAGPSHVLPTGGTARFSSPLNVTDFIKFISLVDLDVESVQKLGPPASVIAQAERFTAHARAVEKRLPANE
jgi:histidinol dehydrogenase